MLDLFGKDSQAPIGSGPKLDKGLKVVLWKSPLAASTIDSRAMGLNYRCSSAPARQSIAIPCGRTTVSRLQFVVVSEAPLPGGGFKWWVHMAVLSESPSGPRVFCTTTLGPCQISWNPTTECGSSRKI
jgi:hypothetical protein